MRQSLPIPWNVVTNTLLKRSFLFPILVCFFSYGAPTLLIRNRRLSGVGRGHWFKQRYVFGSVINYIEQGLQIEKKNASPKLFAPPSLLKLPQNCLCPPFSMAKKKSVPPFCRGKTSLPTHLPFCSPLPPLN